MRALVRSQYRPYHDREILRAEVDAVAKVLATIDAQGPLSPLEFEDRSAELLDALRTAAEHFLYYLRANEARVADGVDAFVRQAVGDARTTSTTGA
jgi:hypothetical protein